jgi:hypothetical protein
MPATIQADKGSHLLSENLLPENLLPEDRLSEL